MCMSWPFLKKMGQENSVRVQGFISTCELLANNSDENTRVFFFAAEHIYIISVFTC